MANISYGRSVKPVVKDNARTRRHMRRMVEAIECRKIEEILASKLGWEPPAQLPDFNPADLSYKRTVSDRVSKAVKTETEYHKQIIKGASSYREYGSKPRHQRIGNEAGRTIHVKQRRIHKPISLI